MAALKGIDLDKEDEKTSKFEEVQKRVEAMRAGKSQDEIELADFGIGFRLEEG